MTAPGNAAAAALFPGGMNPSPTCYKKGYPTPKSDSLFLILSQLRQFLPHRQAVQSADDVALLQQRAVAVAHRSVPQRAAQGVGVGVKQVLGTAGILEMQVA